MKKVLLLFMALMFSILTWGQTVLISPTGDGGFETGATFVDNGWTVVNGTATATQNQWYLGNSATPSLGSGNVAYITNNTGTGAYAYTNSSAMYIVHFYKDVTFPAGETSITLSFDWKGVGETTAYDGLQVSLAPTTTTPVAASAAPTGSVSTNIVTGATFVGNALYFNQASPTTATIYIPASVAGNTSSASTMRLIFTFRMDGSVGTSPGTAIDNISLTSRAMSPLTGLYTINNTLPTTTPMVHDGTGNFSSFTEAINYLNSDGISGAVTFNVTAGQTFAENTPVITATGTVANTITFVKSGAGANPVITPTGTAGTDAGITIAGGDYITFDGIDINASAVTAVEYGYFVRNNPSGIDGAQYNVIKNCSITLNRNTTTATSSSAAIYQNVATAPTSAAGANSYNKYYNLTIQNAINGIYLAGNSSYRDISCEIGTTDCSTRNTISNIGPTTSTLVGAKGIWSLNQEGIKIWNNDITTVAANQSAGYGIWSNTSYGSSEINNNKIQGISVFGSTTTTSVAYGVKLENATSGTNNLKFYNNFISNIYTSFTGTATANRYAIGMHFGIASATTSQSYDIDNNSINIGAGLTPTYSNTCAEIQNGSAIYRVRGNIFVNSTNAQAGAAKHFGIVATAAGLGAVGSVFDYNDYFITNNLGTSGHTGRNQSATTNYNTLADWQGFTTGTLDDLSLSTDPMFASTNDLHASAAGVNAVSGYAYQAWVINDVDCQDRSTLTPADLGADAFDPPSCVQPTALTATNLNYTTATISWTAPAGTPVGYEYEVRTSGTAGSGATGLAASGTTLHPVVSADISGLVGATTYTYYVRTDCGAGDFSPWASSTFNTLSCNVPTGVVASAITTTTATITWVAPVVGSPAGYEYEVRSSGAAGSGATGLAASGTTLAPIVTDNISGLTEATTYSIYVRTNCSVGFYSAWTIAVVFTTNCNPYTVLPHTEPFNTYLPSVCWTEGDGGDITAGPSTINATASSWTDDGFLNSGATGSPKINIDAATDNDWIISPDFTLPATPNYRLKYSVGATQWNGTVAPTTPWEADDFVEVLVTSTGFTNWTVLKTYNNLNVPSNLGQIDILDLSAYAGQTVKFAFRGVEGASNGSADIDFFIDNFMIEEAPACLEPSALVSSAITSNSATISWTASASAPANGYDYYYSTTTTTPDGATVPTGSVAAGVTTADLSSLSANTTYYFWVRSNCDGTNYSAWTGYSSFYTGYCLPAPSSVDNNGITNVTFGQTVIVNNTTSTETNNYGDYSAMVGDGMQFSTLNVNITYQTGYTYGTKIWVDWNNDLDFVDAGELVYSGLSAATNPTTLNASFVIPGTTPIGNYRMRIGGTDDDAGPSTPCYTGIYGTFEDYTLQVTLVPPCYETPTALVASAITTTTATVSWTAPATPPANGYQYYLSTTAAPIPDGTTIPTGVTAAGITSVDLSTLTDNTSYYIWVRANCDDVNFSGWAGSLNFTTLANCVVPTALISSAVTATSATVSWTASISAPANGYEYYVSTTALPVPDGATVPTGVTAAGITTVDLSSLTQNTAYYVWVRANCDGTNLSDWAGALNFTTPFSCPAPSALSVSNILSTSVQINWTENGTATAWNIKASTVNFDPTVANGDFGLIPVGTNPFTTPAVLTPNTLYYYYIQASCGVGDESTWVAGTFTTACGSISTYPFFEGFNNATMPACWTVLNVDGDSKQFVTNNTIFQEGTHSVTVGWNAAGNNDWLISPNFVIDNNNMLLEFYARSNSTTFLESFNVKVSKTDANPASFTTSIASVVNVPNAWTKYTYKLSDFGVVSGDNIHIAIQCVSVDELTFAVDAFTLRQLSSANDILTFSFPEQTGPATIDAVNHTVAIEVAGAANLNGLVPTITVSPNATINPLTGVAQDFTLPFNYTVTAEDLTPQVWTVTVTNAITLSSANDITSFSFAQQTGPATIDAVNHTVAIEVAWTANLTSLVPTIAVSPLASINPVSGVAQNFSSAFNYTVTAENSDEQIWTINVTQQATPAGLTCASPINYGLINDPSVTNVLTAGGNWWYMFTLDQPYANVLVSTCGTNFDNRIAIYDDCADFAGGTGYLIGANPAGSLAYDDDDCNGGEYVSGSANAATHTFTTLDAGTYYVVIYGYLAGSNGNIRLEITGDADACLVPTTLAYTDLQQEEVTLTWNAGFTETAWNLIYGAPGFNPLTEGTTLSNVTTPYNLTGLTENTSYDVYVQAICSGPSTSAWSTVFNFTTLAGCPVPTALNETVTATSANLSWNAWGTTAWNLVASTSPFDPTVSTGDFGVIPVATNPFVTGDILTPNTTYYYYIQADCGAGVTSAWSTQGQFTTECASVELFTENFDAVTSPALPSCWAKYISPSFTFETVNTYTTAPYSAPNCVQLYSSGATAAIDAPLLITTQVSNLNSGTKQLRFFAKGAGTNTSVIVGTMSDPMDAATFVPYQTVTGLSTSAWNEYIISFASYVGTDEYIAFAHPLTTTYSYIYLDNIVLELIPACPTPQSLVGNTVSPTSEMLNWTESGSATEWNVAVSTTPIDPAVGPYAFNFTTTDNPHLLEGLTANTTYYFYVQADCGGDVSAWSNAGTFYTGYCIPAPASQDGTGITNVTFGQTVIVNNTTGSESGYYGNYSTLIGDVAQTTDLEVSITYATGYTYGTKIWVDWNNNLDFTDAGELMYTGLSSANNPTTLVASFNIPNTYPLGNYRMRIGGTDNDAGPDSPCYTGTWGTFEDYTLQVIDAPTCPAPSNLFVDNIGTTTATLHWTENGAATLWNLKASTTPINPVTEPGLFPPTSTGTNPFIIPGGLTPNTTYYWYVQADCGGDVSTWSDGMFTTPCESYTALPFNETFNSDSPTEACWTVLNENGDGDTWDLDYTTNTFEGNQVAIIYTDYNSGANNDYLVSPSITLTGNEILTYRYRVQSAGEPNEFELLLSTTGNSPADFTTVLLPLTSYSNTVYTMQTVDLSAYTGNIYLAWHVPAGGLDGWRLYIDDVWVRALSDENDILTFSFPQQTGAAVIDDVAHTVDIEVAMGTNPVGLVPTFTISDFATIDFASGVAQDFSAPFVYTVTSELGTAQAWTVNVSIATTQSSENDILTFTLPTQTGAATIDAVNHTVDIEVAWNTVLTSLTPTITISTLATINPLSGTAQDFSAPFTYTVTAEDLTPQDWIVTVTNAAIPAGANCANPIVIDQTALPYNELGGSNCGLGDEYESTCLNNYDGGEDIIYRLDMATAGEVEITMTTLDTWTGIAILDACPDTGTCLDFSTLSGAGTHTLNVVLAAGSYYIMIDTWPAPDCISSYDLDIVLIPNPQINVIDLNSDVQDIAVCEGTDVSTVIGQLAQQIVITDTDDTEYTRDLVWTIAGYDANTPADYTATGTFTLPAGVDQTDPATVLEVTATVTINDLPVVTCPADFEVTDIAAVTLTGEAPAGGEYTGTGVTAGEFSADGLANGPYTITYTYTDGTTGCSNFCEFIITVNIPYPAIADIDVNNDVEDVAVCLGAVEADAIALLASQITIEDEDANQYVVDVTWTIAAFDGNTAADYNATGTFELPYNVSQTDPVTPLEVSAIVTVNDLPVVTCPDNMAIASNAGVTTLTGATPAGGAYSGTNVTGDQFDPTGLPLGAYTITYTYTDPTTGCVNSCDFTIDIVVNIINTEVASIAIYPNPNNGIFTLNFSNVNGEVNYQIYDTKGSIIVDENIMTSGNTVKEVELNLVPGVYYVKLITNAQTVVEKLVIE